MTSNDVMRTEVSMKDAGTPKDPDLPVTYVIKVRGKLDAQWADWFNGMTVACEESDETVVFTTLTGAVRDQSALRGILARIWDLGLTLYSVTRLDEERRA